MSARALPFAGPVERPATADQAREAIAAARSDRAPLELAGRGTLRGVGGPVVAARLLDLSGLDAIIAYEPDELVLTCEPGARLADIEALLAARGQQLAFEPPDFRGLLRSGGLGPTLGGAISANLGGPRRIKDGAARDHILGFEGVGGDAVAFKAGGRVVKNVTGFDLAKLVAGAWGTLVALTQVTVRVAPRPQTSLTVALAGLDETAAGLVMNQALGLPLELTAAAHLEPDMAAPLGLDPGAAATLFRLEGFSPSVQARAAHLRQEIGGLGPVRLIEPEASAVLWREIRDLRPFVGEDSVLWRLTLPPASTAQAVSQLRRQTPLRALYDWGGGLVWLATAAGAAPLAAAQMHQLALLHGGQAQAFRAPPGQSVLFAGQPRARALIEARLRSKFDPDGLFNPGRLGPLSG